MFNARELLITLTSSDRPAWYWSQAPLSWPVLIDTKDGEPPRKVEKAEWDPEHKALVLVLE